MGAWFIAFLVYHEGEENFRVQFWNDLDSLGFDCAFLKNFGLKSKEYVDQFDVFIKQSKTEMLSIIGATNGTSLKPTGFVF